jgi:hypothetical protein
LRSFQDHSIDPNREVKKRSREQMEHPSETSSSIDDQTSHNGSIATVSPSLRHNEIAAPVMASPDIPSNLVTVLSMLRIILSQELLVPRFCLHTAEIQLVLVDLQDAFVCVLCGFLSSHRYTTRTSSKNMKKMVAYLWL